MMNQKRFPNGKTKVFNVTYDDGVLQDVRFVALLNKYNLKGTFNLNSGLMESEFEWTHESGRVIKRLSKEKAVPLYQGHEIACHTLTHPYMHDLSEQEILHELQEDKANLKKLFGREVKGFAVPFNYYSERIENCVRQCGFSYARISQESRSFSPQTDYYNWKATVFHTDPELEQLTRQFIETDQELAIFQIVGHSYDLDVENMWERIENVFRMIAAHKEILPMTTIEIVELLQRRDR